MRHPAPALLALAVAASATTVGAAPALRGEVVDALDGRPWAGVRVCLEALGSCVTSGPEGEYALPAPPGIWSLTFTAPGAAPVKLANQRLGARPGRAHLWPARVPDDATPTPSTFGRGRGTGLGPPPHGPVRLDRSPWLAGIPAALPATIRVARYYTGGCSGEYERIDTLDFEEYVKGVVNAEVGVFRGVEGGPDAAAECWKAFAVAARSYALHFVLSQPYDGYDINDTACNQVYKDDRTPEVSAAVEATRGQILVKASDPDVIDRYFYAASCAEHGTEPAYRQGTILPDVTPARACVGAWCGHDDCAAHADNPEVPGEDRCLVWGTCQWGAIERSMAGESHAQILAHYQPGCAIRDFSGSSTGTIKGVVYRAPDLQDRIAGATVTLVGGGSQTYDGQTAWEFEVAPGTYTVAATAAGYLPGSVERAVAAHEVIWGSIGLTPAPEETTPEPEEVEADAGDVADDPAEDDAVAEQGETDTPEGEDDEHGGGPEPEARPEAEPDRADTAADTRDDAGAEAEPPAEIADGTRPADGRDGGCGCAGHGSRSPGWLALLALLPAARRRHRARAA